jgi:hypothetical protein
MIDSTIINGQWEGYFEYGFNYIAQGEKVKFRLTLKDIGQGKFRGECIELEGHEYNPGIATINGFIEASFISFTKEYPVHYKLDQSGKSVPDNDPIKPLINYEGNFDWKQGSFSGFWEICIDNEKNKNGSMICVGSGSWRMHKVK